jgi:hypothetical protein
MSLDDGDRRPPLSDPLPREQAQQIQSDWSHLLSPHCDWIITTLDSWQASVFIYESLPLRDETIRLSLDVSYEFN